jgi:ribulose-phosphate 3-epimerase
MKVRLAPSILSADFGRLTEAAQLAEQAGADLVHVDIMDGHFVQGLTFGPQLVAALKKKVKLPLDVHLMVDNPRDIIPLFLDAGADWVSFHLEATSHLHRELALIKAHQRRAGIALNPGTPLILLNEILRDLDYVLLMAVNPGRGSQPFLDSSLDKITRLSQWIAGMNLEIPVEVDGGVNLQNLERLVQAGASMIVAGSAVFGAEKPAEVIGRMQAIARRVERP